MNIPTPKTDAQQGGETPDSELYAKARAHMEKWSMAASLARPLWDAVVREHDRLEREAASLQSQLDSLRGELGEMTSAHSIRCDEAEGLAGQLADAQKEVGELKAFFTEGGVNWDALNATIARVTKLAEEEQAENISLKAKLRQRLGLQ